MKSTQKTALEMLTHAYNFVFFNYVGEVPSVSGDGVSAMEISWEI